MKKLICLILVSAFVLISLVSCGNGGTPTTGTTAGSSENTAETTNSPATTEAPADPTPTITLSEDELYDKIVGGWLGQMIGVSWAASTEFRYNGVIMPEANMPTWSPNMINDAFGQDDIYVEVPFMDAMSENGALCDVEYMADKFRDSQFPLWHANLAGRNNLQNGIEYPLSGHYLYNSCADDIDWQIECDFLGQMYPALVSAGAARSFEVGHIMNYGDGVYGGVFIVAMHAAAYRADSILEIVETGLSVIPEDTKFRDTIEDVLASYKSGDSWEKCWAKLEKKWASTDKCIAGSGNIDAKLNSAYVAMGLLWGEGDFEDTIIISTRCGQDSDCNPSSAASILGNFLGADAIPQKYTVGLDKDGRKFSNTDYTFNEIIELNLSLTYEVLEANGAVLEDGVWTYEGEKEYTKVPYEQWGDEFGATLTASNIGGGKIKLSLKAVGNADIENVEIDFGDGFISYGNIMYYEYLKNGDYTVKYKISTSDGETFESTLKVNIQDADGAGDLPLIVCTETSPTGGGNKDILLITDGKAGTDSATQYDTYRGNYGPRTEYVGFLYREDTTVKSITFTEGGHFHDGGWFENEIEVEALIDGKWEKVAASISPEYPAPNLTAQGAGFSVYKLTLAGATACQGIRLIGTSGGSAGFISISELSVG